jgi:hypothetical protein
MFLADIVARFDDLCLEPAGRPNDAIFRIDPTMLVVSRIDSDKQSAPLRPDIGLAMADDAQLLRNALAGTLVNRMIGGTDEFVGAKRKAGSGYGRGGGERQ